MSGSVRRLAAIAATFGSVWLAGCGGGGGGSNGDLDLYVTDAFGDGYPQVWATIYRIEIAPAAGTWQTVYDASDGLELNLPDLATNAEFLGTASVSPGAYTRARVTLRNAMRLGGTDGAVADVPLHLGAGNGFAAASGGRCTAEFPVNVTIAENGTADLAVDFDLSSFQMMGNGLQARVREGDRTQLGARLRRGRLVGTVTNLSPGTGFDLRLPNGRIARVALTDATTVVSASSGAEVNLAEGQRVFVFGPWDAATRVVTATVIVVLDVSPPRPDLMPAHIRGKVLSVDASEKSFVVEPQIALMGMRPGAFRVKVLTTDSTVFGSIPRASATFDDVRVDALVDVLGTWDATASTLTARRVLIAR